MVGTLRRGYDLGAPRYARAGRGWRGGCGAGLKVIFAARGGEAETEAALRADERPEARRGGARHRGFVGICTEAGMRGEFARMRRSEIVLLGKFLRAAAALPGYRYARLNSPEPQQVRILAAQGVRRTLVLKERTLGTENASGSPVSVSMTSPRQ